MSCAMAFSEIGSRPAIGSSYMISMGSSAMARASATRRAMPPDSSPVARLCAPRRPTASSFISTRSRIIDSGSVVCSRIGKAMFSYTDRSLNSPPAWNIIPICRRRAYSRRVFSSCTTCPFTLT